MLLRTRFYLPPLRSNGVLRESLLKKLDQSYGGDLVVVSAPAGYGKTTLVSQWLHKRPHQFAWLTLGPEHNSAETFWRYTLKSMQQIAPEIGAHVTEEWQQGNRLSTQEFVVSLLNDLDRLSEMDHSNSAISLVFDDFHYVENNTILDSINAFLDHLPSSIRIIITARDLPQLKLAKRRANGQLLHLDSEALRFSEEEAVSFFHSTMGMEYQDALARQFCSKTEGWVAALQLIALSLRKNPQDGDQLLQDKDLHKHIADYLLEEVFQGLPENMQQFLKVTALPVRFCAGLCNALTGDSAGMEAILKLEQNDLFVVALDNHRTWYRYHDLFRQFLLQQVEQDPADQRPSVIESALCWLQQQGYYEDALMVCIEQRRWSSLKDLLRDEYVQQALQQQPGQLQQLLKLIPQEIIQQGLSIPEIESQNNSDAPAGALALVEPLTQREQKVMELIGEGISNKEIADQLHISLNTLKVHIRNLYGKLGVENRSQALIKMKSLG